MRFIGILLTILVINQWEWADVEIIVDPYKGLDYDTVTVYYFDEVEYEIEVYGPETGQEVDQTTYCKQVIKPYVDFTTQGFKF